MSAPGNREVAHRLFAAEFDDADYSYSESDEERAPNYVVSPTGARINRLFVVGVLTEVSQAGESILRARVVDPTGAFVAYAGQYQPEAMAFLDRTTPPAFVAVTGKARTFQPEDSDVVYTSVRPESISEVDTDTRDRWTVTAAERTLERIGTVAAALDTGLTGDALREALVRSGVDESLATGIPIALERYGTTRAYLAALQETALEAVRLVTGDVEEVSDLDVAPDEGGDTPFTPAVDVTVTGEDVAAAEPDTGAADDDREGETAAEPAGASASSDRSAAAADEPSESAGPSETSETSEAPEAPGTTAATGAETGAESTESTTGPTTDEGDGDLSDAEAEVSATDATPEAGIEAPGPDSDADLGSASEESGTADESEPDLDSDEEIEASEPSDTTATTDPPEASADAAEPSAATDEDGTSPEAGEEEAVEPGEFDLDDETRQEVEEEFGTDFSTGNEVAPAGEADIDPPDRPAEDEADIDADPETRETSLESDAPSTDEKTGMDEETGTDDPDEPTFEAVDPDETPSETADGEPESEGPAREPPAAADEPPEPAEADADPLEDADLEAALLDAMRQLDDGDGADRRELIARVSDETGVDADAVEDAIQDALMSGQCYEPEDGRLKPI